MDDRKTDKAATILLESLRHALADTGEHRLFKSGKLDGLFPGKSGPSGDAAAEAMRSGYLESVRIEEKGKITIEWVRLTPKGVEFIYQHDSPRTVLDEMQAMLKGGRDGVPGWLTAVLEQLNVLSKTFAEEMKRYLQRLDGLTKRVEEALRRSEAGVPALTDPLQALVPWGLDALGYLDRRKLGGTTEPCALPELFAAVREKHPLLAVPDFHKGLKRLADNRAVTLLPHAGNGHIPEPEYAIPSGGYMLYLVSR